MEAWKGGRLEWPLSFLPFYRLCGVCVFFYLYVKLLLLFYFNTFMSIYFFSHLL